MITEGAEVLVFLLYAGAGALVVIGGLLMRTLLQRTTVPESSTEAYECGEQPIGLPFVPFSWQYIRIVVLLLVLEAEVLLALPWVWVQRQISVELFWLELGILILPLAAIYAYALRSGWLTFSPPPKAMPLPPPAYRQLNAYLLSQGQAPSSYSSHPDGAPPPPSPDGRDAPQTPAEAAPRTPDAQYSDPGKTQSP